MISTTTTKMVSPLGGLSAQMTGLTIRSRDSIITKERERGDGDTIEVKHFDPVRAEDSNGHNPKEIFEKSVSQKKNIYSTDAIPLNSPWTFWVDRTARGVNMEQFEANLRRIYTVYTVQRFWAVYYNIPKPSDLQPRSSLHMMRDERRPLWEEDYNCQGGTFRLRVNKKDSNKVWKELLMAAIGEQLNEFVSDNDEICGVSVSIREKEDVLLIWNTNANAAKECRIFECIHMLMPDTVFLSTFYKPHVTHHAFKKSRIALASTKMIYNGNGIGIGIEKTPSSELGDNVRVS